MITIFSAIFAYLVLGFFLTRYVAAPARAMKFNDVVLGSMFMPLIILALLFCMLYAELWKRLLIVLHFDPPEELRAGPDSPGAPDSEEA